MVKPIQFNPTTVTPATIPDVLANSLLNSVNLRLGRIFSNFEQITLLQAANRDTKILIRAVCEDEASCLKNIQALTSLIKGCKEKNVDQAVRLQTRLFTTLNSSLTHASHQSQVLALEYYKNVPDLGEGTENSHQTHLIISSVTYSILTLWCQRKTGRNIFSIISPKIIVIIKDRVIVRGCRHNG